MTMLSERPGTLIPLEQAIAELDSPEAVADRRKRAVEWATRLAGPERNQMIGSATRDAVATALAPLNSPNFHWGQPSERERKEANKQATQNVDALVVRQCEGALRRSDEADLYRDPARLCEQHVWNLYTAQVSSVAWTQGNQSDAWIARWRSLVSDRAAAEAYGDPTGAIDARLERHVGVRFPVLPDAAWDAADMLPAAERQAELDRLEAVYGPRDPVPEAPKRRVRK